MCFHVHLEILPFVVCILMLPINLPNPPIERSY
jgi:hypothetical protein